MATNRSFYPAVTIVTEGPKQEGFAFSVSVVIGQFVSVDLGLDKFPGLPKAAVVGINQIDGNTFHFKADAGYSDVANALSEYFTIVAKAFEEYDAKKKEERDAASVS